MMSKEENAKLARELLNKQKSPSYEVYTDEDMWKDIKLKARAFLQADSLCITDEDREQLKKRIDTFSKYGPAIVKACSERYKRDVLEQDVKVKQAHEINETAKLYASNPNAAVAAINSIAQIFGASTPQVTAQPKPAIEAPEEEVIADVKLSED